MIRLLSAAPLKKKRGRPRKIKVEEEDESFAEPLVTFKVKDKEDIRNHFSVLRLRDVYPGS
jgi:hypothetical protein